MIDLVLHFGVPEIAKFLLEDAVQARDMAECSETCQDYGYMSPLTVSSERCHFQRIKAAMLSKDAQNSCMHVASEDWSRAEEQLMELFGRRGRGPSERGQVVCSGRDRIPEAHALLGECRYRAVRDAGGTSALGNF